MLSNTTARSVAFALILTATPAWAQISTIDLCTTLAANPLDPATPAGAGVEPEYIDIANATEACTSAIEDPMATPQTHYLLGRVLGQAGNYADANVQFELAAAGGSSMALNALGMAYEFGEGVEADPAKAVDYYREAYELDQLPLAAANLGYVHAYGVGMEVDYEQAKSYFEIAAEQDNLGWAANELGLMYEYGNGVEVDYLKAADYYKAAYKAGEPVGAYNLGVLYDNGRGVAEDDVEAVRYFQLAADAGNAYGLNNLALMYAGGLGGLEASGERALELHMQAAEGGNPFGWTGAASLYSAGVLIPQDLERARELNLLASESGDPIAVAAANNGLAWGYVLQNSNFEDAEALARQAIEGDSEFGSYHDTLAWTLQLQGRSAEALPHAERAVELDDADPHLHAHLGDILVALGRPDDARTAYQAAVETAPGKSLDATVDLDAIEAWLAAN